MYKKIFAAARAPDVCANLAGGVAYQMPPEAALAQYVLTGCFNSTYYADAAQDTQRIVDLANQVEPLFLAQLAVYGREKGYMKDAPALLVAMLSVRSPQLFQACSNGSSTTRRCCATSFRRSAPAWRAASRSDPARRPLSPGG